MTNESLSPFAIRCENGVLCTLETLTREDGRMAVLLTHGGSGVLLTEKEAQELAQKIQLLLAHAPVPH